jgi:glucose-6-phosphate 1-dehydrogenase
MIELVKRDNPEMADGQVVFGGTGDLALRMLFPSLFFLDRERLLPEQFPIVGTAREAIDQDGFIRRVKDAVSRRLDGAALDETEWRHFADRIVYLPLDATVPEQMTRLADKLSGLGVRAPLFYLSTSPSVFAPICNAIRAAGLAEGKARIALEKPIGRDLATSHTINDAVGAAFSEHRVFRIDHYLGKETVQNLLALRFANTLFEPLWNNLAIDHVQITVAETDGIGDRWRYYDEYGAIRDMVQNHILQLLCLVAMEPPSDLTPDAVRDEKVKVLRALRPITGEAVRQNTVRGQYVAGLVEGRPCPAYVDEKKGPSDTETFVALRADIDNWRWAGVPFFIRSGKRLPVRRTQIVVQFKPVPHSIFSGSGRDGLTANRLVIDLQPEEDIQLLLMNKAPGLDTEGMRLQTLPLSLKPGAPTRRRIAYERLLIDAIKDNPTLFVRRDEVERAWQWVDTIVEGWVDNDFKPKPYAAGTWGPSGADLLIERSNRSWND